MAKLSFSRWLSGLNTRLNKFLLGPEDATEAIDVDLSGAEIKPEKGLDSSITASGDYRWFEDHWVIDEDARKFTPSGDYLIKSYGTKAAEFVRKYYTSSGTFDGIDVSKPLSVPPKPTAPVPVKKT